MSKKYQKLAEWVQPLTSSSWYWTSGSLNLWRQATSSAAATSSRICADPILAPLCTDTSSVRCFFADGHLLLKELHHTGIITATDADSQ